jgi:hypothetical protein
VLTCCAANDGGEGSPPPPLRALAEYLASEPSANWTLDDSPPTVPDPFAGAGLEGAYRPRVNPDGLDDPKITVARLRASCKGRKGAPRNNNRAMLVAFLREQGVKATDLPQ